MSASSSLFPSVKPIESEEDDLVFTLKQHSKKERAKIESEDSFFRRTQDPTPNPLIETNKQEAETLNAASASCLQFKLSEEEQQKIAHCDKTSEEIEQQVRVLGLTRLANGKIKKALQFVEDKELCELVKNHFKAGYSEGGKQQAFSATVDRINQTVSIEISYCKDVEKLKAIFSQFVKATPKVSYESISRASYEQAYKSIITFKLRDRDELLKGLQLSKQIYSVPVARQFMQGC